jgi:fructose-1,6-bisphosphatase/inositol monophosphatase family enzyme
MGVDWHIKADNTFVTEADKAIEEFLVDRIQKQYPDHRIIAEEGSRFDGNEYTWAIDPIDGTSAFVWGIPTWCISVGVLRNKEPYWGLVYYPLLQELYVTEDGVAKRNGRQIHVEDQVTTNSLICISPRALQYYNLEFSGYVCSFASGVMHNCMVARGSAVAALTLKPSIWDLAGILPILKAAGSDLQYISGRQVILSELIDAAAAEPMVAGHPKVIDYVLEHVIQKKK